MPALNDMPVTLSPFSGEWNVYSYVRTTNATTSVLDVSDFLRDLVAGGWMTSPKHLSGMQAGTEVFSGSSQLDTRGFYCRVQ